MTLYRRLRDAPRKCETCGAVEANPLPLELPLSHWVKAWLRNNWATRLYWRARYFFGYRADLGCSFSDLLKTAYSGWHVVRRKFPLRRLGPFWRWDAYCATCIMRRELEGPGSFLLSKVSRGADFRGGTFSIPFGEEGK